MVLDCSLMMNKIIFCLLDIHLILTIYIWWQNFKLDNKLQSCNKIFLLINLDTQNYQFYQNN